MNILHDLTFEELYEAYLSCRIHKRSTAEAVEFEMNLPVELLKLYNELITGTYEIGPSVVFLLTSPCWREVFAAKFRDRIVHHLVMGRIEHLFEGAFIENTFSCRHGKGVLHGIQKCQEHVKQAYEEYGPKAIIVKCDIKSFFTSIDKRILKNKLLELINASNIPNKEFVIDLVIKIVDNCPAQNFIRHQPEHLWERLPSHKSLFKIATWIGMAIGNLTSQWFANFFLNILDHLILSHTKYYGRYVDDFYFIIPDKKSAYRVLEAIREQLKLDNLKLNEHKTYMQPIRHGIKFIGSNLDKDKRYMIRRTITNFYKNITRFKFYADNHVMYMEDLEYIVSCLNSYLGILQQFNAYRLRKKILDNKKLFGNLYKYMYPVNDYKKIKLKKPSQFGW